MHEQTLSQIWPRFSLSGAKSEVCSLNPSWLDVSHQKVPHAETGQFLSHYKDSALATVCVYERE